jgi:very-short-patch-repair endonuclease
MKLTKANLPIWLKSQYPDVISEYKFVPTRRFKADFYLPSLNCIVEYEGVFCGKSRHTNVIGYTNDCTKYNFATKLGFKVLRYTAKNLNDIAEDLAELKESLK